MTLPKKVYESISKMEGHIQHIPLDDGGEGGSPEHIYIYIYTHTHTHTCHIICWVHIMKDCACLKKAAAIAVVLHSLPLCPLFDFPNCIQS